jgi:hypothetical protein
MNTKRLPQNIHLWLAVNIVHADSHVRIQRKPLMQVGLSGTYWLCLILTEVKKSNFILLSNINFPLIIIKNIILQF